MTLKKLLDERNITQKELSQATGIPEPTLSLKMNGKTKWTDKDIKSIKEVLTLTPIQIDDIFLK